MKLPSFFKHKSEQAPVASTTDHLKKGDDGKFERQDGDVASEQAVEASMAAEAGITAPEQSVAGPETTPVTQETVQAVGSVAMPNEAAPQATVESQELKSVQ